MRGTSHSLVIRVKLGLFQEALGSSMALASAAIATLLYYPAVAAWLIVPLSIGFLGVFLASLRGTPSSLMLVSLWCYVASSLVLAMAVGLPHSRPIVA